VLFNFFIYIIFAYFSFHVVKTSIFHTNSFVTHEIEIVIVIVIIYFSYFLSHIHIFGYTTKTVIFGIDFGETRGKRPILK